MFELSLSHEQGAFRLDVDLALNGRGVTALFGPSGSGKTTLLRLMAGLDRPDTGRIVLDGQVLVDTRVGLFVPVHRRRLGVVFQEARLFPHYSVRGNLCYGMPARDEPALQRMARLLGIEPLLDRMPGRLSGGEARRVAIGRALLTRPRLLLLDEPLTGLDGDRKQELLGYLAALVRDIEIPVIFVSHDPQELLAVADDLVLMQHGQVRASGPLDTLLARPELMPFLGGFDVSAMLRVVCHRVDPDRHLNELRLADGQRLEVPALNVSPGAVLKIQIRARDVALALTPPEQTSIRNVLGCRVTGLHHTSTPGVTLVALAVGGQVLRALISTASCEALALREGQKVLALVRAVSLARPA
ncbi:molybdenum ABC transporter ATP-binding protein [Larsenimonas rhizosphaerae]|uniref:Molybdenum ABC transporter ATP-binding protein n=1 Tax=Larsenimonas rhizosphaerae TaxID=2944682 RepID=A0AA41ZDR0_9GAMM|nr:molybdenum ABC transporter ATP-binding protein [Larsenimonas rhizosphaerae]MCX2522661.1 molybdenum ABC transporter ATP-binding protein [Larsenimonas rhizosphaerae]